MKKITFFTYFISLLIFAFAFSASASASYDLYHDEVGLLTENEAEYISELLNETEDTYEIRLIIAVVNDTGYKSAYNFAADFLDSALGSSESGAILLFSMEERDWAVYAIGGARHALTDSRIDSIMNILVSDYFSLNDYYNGFSGFINQCTAYFLKSEAEGIDLSAGYIGTDEDKLSVSACILISLGIGLAAAIITVLILRGQLKSVKSAKNASVYVDHGSFNLTESRDIYLYSTVTKTPKPQNSSSGSRSRLGGGRNGKF